MPDEPANLDEHLLALRRQLAGLQEQVAALREQQAKLYALVVRSLPGWSEGSSAAPGEAPPAASTQEILADCAQDLVRVLGDAGRPLTTLEILEEMVHRGMRWRESTVSHTLVGLLDQGVVGSHGNGGTRRYDLKNKV